MAVARACATTAKAIQTGRGGVERTLVALLGRELCRERLSPIADALGVDLARISQLAATGRRLAVEDREFGQRLRAVEANLARK